MKKTQEMFQQRLFSTPWEEFKKNFSQFLTTTKTPGHEAYQSYLKGLRHALTESLIYYGKGNEDFYRGKLVLLDELIELPEIIRTKVLQELNGKNENKPTARPDTYGG